MSDTEKSEEFNLRFLKWTTTEGGPRSDVIRPRKWHFNPFSCVENALEQLLDKHYGARCDMDVCINSIRRFDIAIMIGGAFRKIEESNVCNVRYNSKRKIMYVDINIPESRWVGKIAREFQEYYADMIRLCFEKCLERAKKIKGEVLDEQGFIDRYESAIKEYLKLDFSDIPIGRPPGVLPTTDDLRIEEAQKSNNGP